ncbi:MAG: FtsK/SpoIIIE domain-containing protein [Anaerolineales bacterium]
MVNSRLVGHIADRAARCLEQANLLGEEQGQGPVFYVWPREDRLILAFDPMAGDKIDQVISEKFTHRLSTVLAGRRVVATNSRGLFLQIGYYPEPVADLRPRPLDLSQQPGPLHVPLGITKRGPLWLPLPQMDAVLVGGSRRMGKTRLLHGWIQALIRGGRAHLVLWDGKGGVEFGRYAGREGVTVPEALEDGLAQVAAEMARRERLFVQAGVPDVGEYVRRTGDRLPALVLILDEVAFLENAEQEALAHLVSVGGAFGIYPVLATQHPDADAVQSLVKANLSTRIALPVPAHQDSQVILGRTGAEKLPKEKGRLLLTWEGRLVEAQAFLVELPEAEGATAAPVALLTAAERRLAEIALGEFEGWFPIQDLADAAGESRDHVNRLAKRWEALGYLTEVQRNENGHIVGRQATEALIRLIRA